MSLDQYCVNVFVALFRFYQESDYQLALGCSVHVRGAHHRQMPNVERCYCTPVSFCWTRRCRFSICTLVLHVFTLCNFRGDRTLTARGCVQQQF